MTHITLTDDQTRQLSAANDEVVISDATGRVVAHVPKISDEEESIIAECLRRATSDSPRIPFSEVIKKIDSSGDR